MSRRLRGASRGGIIPKEFFSVHINNLASTYPAIVGPITQTPYHDFGQGYVRILDNRCTPKFVAPTSGTYDWTTLDQTIATIRANGAKVIYVFGNLPDWMTGATTTAGSAYSSFPPLNVADMVAVYTAIATRYAGQIDAFQIWNEPNLTRYWTGTTAQLAALAEATYNAVKAVSPSVPVISPCFVSLPGLSMMDEYFRLGAGAFSDIISINGYLDPNRPELMMDRIAFGKGVAAQNGQGGKPFWVVEVGYTTYYNNGTLIDINGAQMPDALGAAYVARMIFATWLGGAAQMGFYAADTDVAKNRLISSADLTAKTAAGQALAFVAGLLTGGTLSGFKQTADATGKAFYQASFSDSEGQTGRVFWCADDQTATVDLSGYSEGVSVLGAAVVLSASYALTPSPVFAFA